MDDPLVHCPFELAHTCKQSRFQKHLIKCRKNHPESKLEPCPYNATEYIHPDDLIEHLKVCKNAKLLEGQKYSAELHRENYLDAPFHMPKREVEPEDFEGQEVRVNDSDERVLERSVSQMSLNSISSVHLAEGNDNAARLTPINLTNRDATELPTRLSTVRGVGRGHAMAKLISVLHQTDGMDYSKYEIKSTVTDSKSQAIDPEFAPPSKFSPVRHGNISLFERKQEEDESKFQDCSSEEELEAYDNASVCSSQSTIIENNFTSIESKRQSWAATPEPQRTIPLYDSDDDETHTSDVETDGNSTFNYGSENVVSVNCISVCRNESPDSISNERDSSSNCSFYSLIRENLLQNDMRVRGLENEERMMSFGRGRPGYCNQNRPFGNYRTRFEGGGAPPPSVGGRGAMLNAICNSNAQSNSMNNRGRSHHFNQNGYQNYPNRPQQAQSNYNNRGSHANRNQQNYSNSNRDDYPQRPYSNQSNQSGHSNGNQKFMKRDHDPKQLHSNQSNGGSYSNQNWTRGSFNQAKSIGRGFHNEMNSFGPGDLYLSNSVGRGNLSHRLNPPGSRDGSCHDDSIGRGKLVNQRISNSSSRGSFQENSYGRGNFQAKDNGGRKTNPYSQEQFNARGNYSHEGNSFSRQGFSNYESSLGRGNSHGQVQSIGRGNSFNQIHSVGRGNHFNQENQSFNQAKPQGRANQFASMDSSESQPNPVGRGRLLMSSGASQLTNCRNNESFGRGQPNTANHYSDMDNFRGKSTEISLSSFEAVYNTFKDWQISDYSPVTSPKQMNEMRAPRPFAQVTPAGSPIIPLNATLSLAESKESSVNPTMPKKNNSKVKKKKKKPKEISLKSSVVAASIESVTNVEGALPAPSESNFKILDKSMDPKKYFGADSDHEVNPNQDNNNKVNSTQFKTSSNQNSNKVNSKQSKTKADSKQNTIKVSSKQDKSYSKARPKQDSSDVSPKQDSSEANSKLDSGNADPKQDSGNANLNQDSGNANLEQDNGNVKQGSNKTKSKQGRRKANAKQVNIDSKSKEDENANSKQNASNSNLKVNKNVSLSASNCSDTKFRPSNKVAPINRENKFQVYDQFYSNMSFGPLNSQVNFNYNSKNKNKLNHQGSMAPIGSFNERIEEDERQNLPKVYASVNFLRFSEKPVEAVCSSNIPSDSLANASEKLAFSSLHEPQRPRVPGRYDKLSGTGYKFVFRQLNRKQKVLSHKPKFVSRGKKPHNLLSVNEPTSQEKKLYDPSSNQPISQEGKPYDSSSVNANQPSISKVSQAKKLFNPLGAKSNQLCAPNVKVNATVLKTNVSSNTSGTESVKQKRNLNRKAHKNTNVPQETKVFHSSKKSKHFEDQNTRSDMSLWNKKSYRKISSGDEPSFNPLFKPQMSQWAPQMSFANNNLSNSYVDSSAYSESNYYPFDKSQMSLQSFRTSSSGFVKNAQSRKHSFVVMKEKINHTQRKFAPKNFDQSRLRLRYPNGFNFSSLLSSNPFEKPLAFGPTQSSHLEYSSHKPLQLNPF